MYPHTSFSLVVPNNVFYYDRFMQSIHLCGSRLAARKDLVVGLLRSVTMYGKVRKIDEDDATRNVRSNLALNPHSLASSFSPTVDQI